MKMNIPDVSAQKKAADALTTIDKIIELDKRRGELLKRLKLGIEQKTIGKR